jgi:hypothetical protein
VLTAADTGAFRENAVGFNKNINKRPIVAPRDARNPL